MKHLRLFETTAEFDAAKPNLDEPWVTLTEDDGNVHFMDGGEPTPTHEYVDLGLPSGLKWAKCNIGADTEEGYGKYFMWGDVEGRTADEIADKPCDWAHTPFNGGASGYDDDYFNAHKSEWLDGDILKPEYDAATRLMGEGWRMPIDDEFDELINNTNIEWVTNYNGSGVNGRKFISKTDSTKYIFIPANGYAWHGLVERQGSDGYVWSSSFYTDYPKSAGNFDFTSDRCDISDNFRYYGHSVRGVRS